jgi:peptide/nickel transport system ATP-binding protein
MHPDSAEHEKLAAPEILKLTGFKVHYPIRQGLFKRVVDHVKAVDDVSFTLQVGKTSRISIRGFIAAKGS